MRAVNNRGDPTFEPVFEQILFQLSSQTYQNWITTKETPAASDDPEINKEDMEASEAGVTHKAGVIESRDPSMMGDSSS